MHLLPPSPSLPTLCPSVAQRLELGWPVIRSPGTHPRLDAARLDPLPAGLVYDQGTETPVPSPSWRQIIASFKCILSVEGNSFSGCRQSACAELIVTVALISIPAHPRSFPPSGMAGVQVCAWAWCQGHPRYPNRSRAWPESSRVPSTHFCPAAESRGVFLAPPPPPPQHTTLICHQRIPTAKRKEPVAGGLCHELGLGAKLQTKPSSRGGGWQWVPLAGRQLGAGWVLAAVAQRLSCPPTQGTGGDTRRFAPSQGWVLLGGRAGH